MAQRKIFQIEAEGGRIIHGTRRTDFLHGTEENDVIYGFGRGDVIFGSGGRDYINGGSGFDIVSYDRAAHSIQVALNGRHNAFVYIEDPTRTEAFYADHNAVAAEKEAIAQLLYNGEAPFSMRLPKFIPGYVLKDVVRKAEGVVGGHGDDLLVGDRGDNFLVGGLGEDILVGGDGADDFAYSAEHTYSSTLGVVDAILDFNHNEGDTIDLSEILYDHENPLLFVGERASYTSGIPYSVFYKKGIDPSDNPLYKEPRFRDGEGNPVFKGEDGLSLMIDFDGDARSDFMIAIWGVDEIRLSDLAL